MKTSRSSASRSAWGNRRTSSDSTPNTDTVKGEEVMKIKKLVVLAVVALVAWLVAAPITSVEAGGSTRLRGTLTIAFSDPEPNPVIPMGFTFTVTDQVKVGGVTIPREVRGGTFTTNAACDVSGIDDKAGRALLRLKNEDQGTVFKAFVTSGAFFCILRDGATRVDSPMDDPFQCSKDADFLVNAALCVADATQSDEVLNSAIGEGSVWIAQILADDPDGNTVDNETEMRGFFNVPAARTTIMTRFTTVKSSQTTSNNRGGSAAGINNSAVDFHFKNP